MIRVNADIRIGASNKPWRPLASPLQQAQAFTDALGCSENRNTMFLFNARDVRPGERQISSIVKLPSASLSMCTTRRSILPAPLLMSLSVSTHDNVMRGNVYRGELTFIGGSRAVSIMFIFSLLLSSNNFVTCVESPLRFPRLLRCALQRFGRLRVRSNNRHLSSVSHAPLPFLAGSWIVNSRSSCSELASNVTVTLNGLTCTGIGSPLGPLNSAEK
jgi:hypothetical protein